MSWPSKWSHGGFKLMGCHHRTGHAYTTTYNTWGQFGMDENHSPPKIEGFNQPKKLGRMGPQVKWNDDRFHEMEGDPLTTKPHVRTLTPMRQTAGSLWECYLSNVPTEYCHSQSFSIILSSMLPMSWCRCCFNRPNLLVLAGFWHTPSPCRQREFVCPAAGLSSLEDRVIDESQFLRCCCAPWGLWLWRTDDGRDPKGSLNYEHY